MELAAAHESAAGTSRLPSPEPQPSRLSGVQRSGATRRSTRCGSQSCDGFRMPARSLSLPHAPKASGPAFESRQWKKPRAGSPISRRYGSQVFLLSSSAQWRMLPAGAAMLVRSIRSSPSVIRTKEI